MIDGEEEVRAELRRRMARRGAAKALAFDLGVSRQALCNMRDGRRRPSPRVAEGLGFRRVSRFERVE